MKISKYMLHWELQPYFLTATLIKLTIHFAWATRLMNRILSRRLQGKDIDELDCSERFIPSSDGSFQIRTRIYQPKGSESNLPIMLYCHGGGYIAGSPEQCHEIFKQYMRTRPCIIVAPDYRKSYTQPFPAGFNDCYDSLLWAQRNAEALGGNKDSIIVAGHSAGGGLTAALTLKARDTGEVKIAFQMPIYPMIDDQQPLDPARYIDAPVWDSRTNSIGWNAYLIGLKKSGQDIPAYAAPARNSDYSNFPPTMTFVGTLDPFHQETRSYVENLKEAKIDVAYAEFKGCFHGFEMIFTDTGISRQATQFSLDQYAEFYDKYAK